MPRSCAVAGRGLPCRSGLWCTAAAAALSCLRCGDGQPAQDVSCRQTGACASQAQLVGQEEQEPECVFEGPEDIFEWVRARGGFVDRRLKVAEGPLGRGMFATEAIGDKETIVLVPFELILQERAHPCQTVEAFAGELRKGRCSQYWPYLQFIRDAVVDVPDAWSLDELSLLDGLPPGDWRIHTNRLTAECTTLDLSDSFVARALMLYASRSGPFGMQPVFDIFNHGYNSTVHQEIFPQDPAARAHIFVTARDIATGEEIFNIFRPGAGAGRAAVNAMSSRGMQFDGAPELFRDYGFVERPPVMWWFDAPPKAAGGGSAAESKKRRFRWVIESDVGDVYWPEPDAVDWAEFVREARKLLRELAARARAFREAGVHCADHLLGNTPEGELPSCGMQGASERRVLLALHYRAAFEHALRDALASAEEKLGGPTR